MRWGDENTWGITYSLGNRRATAIDNWARSHSFRNLENKPYFEITLTTLPGGNGIPSIGVSNDGWATGGGGDWGWIGGVEATGIYSGTGPNMYMASNGADLTANSGIIKSGNLVATDVVCVAWDIAADLVWMRVNAGNWNCSATANPSTATEGCSTSHISGTTRRGAMDLGGATSIGTVIDINGGQVPFAQAVPAGFSAAFATNLRQTVRPFQHLLVR